MKNPAQNSVEINSIHRKFGKIALQSGFTGSSSSHWPMSAVKVTTSHLYWS